MILVTTGCKDVSHKFNVVAWSCGRTGRDVGQLGRKGGGARRVSELDLGRLVLVIHLGHLVRDRSEVELMIPRALAY